MCVCRIHSLMATIRTFFMWSLVVLEERKKTTRSILKFKEKILRSICLTWLDDQNRKRLYRVNSRQVNNVTKIQKQREETAIITWMLMIQPGTISQISFRVVLELYVLYIRPNQWKCYSSGKFYTISFQWHKCFSIRLFICIRKLCVKN